MNGNVIYISASAGGDPIAATKSDEIDTLCELIEKASATQSQWREYDPGRKEWGMTVNWLVTASSDIQKLLYNGGTYTLNVVHRNGSTKTTLLSGTALCQQAKVISNRNGLVNGSFVFKGSGPLAAPSVNP